MVRSSAVLLLEFNELTPRLMDRFIDEGHLPNFERFRSESTVMITDPEEDQSGLEPWIQWVTVHTGLGRDDHGLGKLGEAEKLDRTTIGEAVSGSDRAVWLCGSMNLPRRAAGSGAYLPDPWNPDSTPSPRSFAAFSDFVRANVQEHSNAAVRLTPSAAGRFGWFLTRHGLSLTTVQVALRQLVAERRNRRGRWARASVLDRFQWDLFRWQWRRQRPTFATFFSNSTAHYQHLFWRNLEPERFRSRPSADNQEKFGGAVLHGYVEMDRIVGEAMELADAEDATLMFCSALSQQPYLQAEDAGGKYIYRPHRFDDLVRALELSRVRQVSPVMAEQFHILFESGAAASVAAKRLEEATVDGERAFDVRVVDDDVFTGCALHGQVASDAQLRLGSEDVGPFADLFYRSDSPKSGFHHPDGLWWIRTGTHRTVAAPVPLRSVAPTILTMLGVTVPDSMKKSQVVLPSR